MATRTIGRISRLGTLCVVCSLVFTVFWSDTPKTALAAPADAGWTTSGARILTPTGAPFVITGINWYGFETRSNVAHGLYARDYTDIIGEIKTYGYNTIRIPFSSQMWETDPIPNRNTISACSSCRGTHSRDILANIINYAGQQGLHVILDNHRSESGNSAEANGLWYTTGRHQTYTEQQWIQDWREIQSWVHGEVLGNDHVQVNLLAADGFPIVLGYELRNEPHTPSRTAYLNGATWGTGDGINPTDNPNPNPFAPACVADSTCHDWRLAAERAADMLLGDAASKGWAYPLIFVDGISQYPTADGTVADGPYDYYWWGGNLLGVNGNATHPGAPIVLNAGGTKSALGPAVNNQAVYSTHDFGPSEYPQGWFNSETCYPTGCSSSSLADVWTRHWAYINTPDGVRPTWNGAPYPWGNTSAVPYTQAPIYIGEWGTGNANSDLEFSGHGSQGQWFTDLANFIQSSYMPTRENSSGIPVTSLNWTYWALNTEDSYALLGNSYTGLANPRKEYSFLCVIQQGPLAVPPGSGEGQCGSTGALPNPQ